MNFYGDYTDEPYTEDWVDETRAEVLDIAREVWPRGVVFEQEAFDGFVSWLVFVRDLP